MLGRELDEQLTIRKEGVHSPNPDRDTGLERGVSIPVTFDSILFLRAEDRARAARARMPECFADLLLDQVVDAVTLGLQDYDLQGFFFTALRDIDAIRYRHEVFRELESPTLLADIVAFAHKMREMRQHLEQANALYYKHQKEWWFLHAVEVYCDAVDCLLHALNGDDLKSRGFLAFRDYLTTYAHSEGFTSLVQDTKERQADLGSIRYSFLIKGSRVTVGSYAEEVDYSAEVEATFAKFKQGAVKDCRIKYRDTVAMNHIEAWILDGVANLHPGIFQHLDTYCVSNEHYLDPTVAAFDREVQFYISYLAHMARLKRASMTFCYPSLSDASKEVLAAETFDLALANKLLKESKPVVCNDLHLSGKERIVVVSGPNQGGKTTFARTFGQLHYLASLGCPVPGREARLFLFDELFTLFEREEKVENLRGKLQDDLVRIHGILASCTPRSIVILNEIFNSTSLTDAIWLSRKIIEQIIDLDMLCLCVTFIEELASLGPQTVSMVSTIVPENPALRTFKVLRRPADGLAYALSIAEKYRLTYGCLKERLAP